MQPHQSADMSSGICLDGNNGQGIRPLAKMRHLAGATSFRNRDRQAAAPPGPKYYGHNPLFWSQHTITSLSLRFSHKISAGGRWCLALLGFWCVVSVFVSASSICRQLLIACILFAVFRLRDDQAGKATWPGSVISGMMDGLRVGVVQWRTGQMANGFLSLLSPQKSPKEVASDDFFSITSSGRG